MTVRKGEGVVNTQYMFIKLNLYSAVSYLAVMIYNEPQNLLNTIIDLSWSNL